MSNSMRQNQPDAPCLPGATCVSASIFSPGSVPAPQHLPNPRPNRAISAAGEGGSTDSPGNLQGQIALFSEIFTIFFYDLL
jgi:hypothetical protein